MSLHTLPVVHVILRPNKISMYSSAVISTDIASAEQFNATRTPFEPKLLNVGLSLTQTSINTQVVQKSVGY